jgi:hypothetical protein
MSTPASHHTPDAVSRSSTNGSLAGRVRQGAGVLLRQTPVRRLSFREPLTETVRKGSSGASGASILAPRAAKRSFFAAFRGFVRPRFGARRDFSDSFSR